MNNHLFNNLPGITVVILHQLFHRTHLAFNISHDLCGANIPVRKAD